MSGSDSRPRPEYGEYATPEEQRAAIKDPGFHEAVLPPVSEETAETAETDAAHAAPVPPYVPGQAQQQNPYQQPYQQQPYQAPYQQQPRPVAPRTGAGLGDRVATFVLLGFGLYNVLSMVSVATSGGSALKAESEMLGGSVDISAFPHWVWIGSSIAYAVIWVIALFASIASLRARRRSFWIPLVAGVLATAIGVALMLIAVGQDPSLMSLVPAPSGTTGTET